MKKSQLACAQKMYICLRSFLRSLAKSKKKTGPKWIILLRWLVLISSEGDGVPVGHYLHAGDELTAREHLPLGNELSFGGDIHAGDNSPIAKPYQVETSLPQIFNKDYAKTIRAMGSEVKNCLLICLPGEQSGPDLKHPTCVKCPKGYVQNKTCCADIRCKCRPKDDSVPNSEIPEMNNEEGSKIIDMIESGKNRTSQFHNIVLIAGIPLGILTISLLGCLAYKKRGCFIALKTRLFPSEVRISKNDQPVDEGSVVRNSTNGLLSKSTN